MWKSRWLAVLMVPLGLFASMGSSRAHTRRPLAARLVWDPEGVLRLSREGGGAGQRTLVGGLAGRLALAAADPERSLGVHALHLEVAR